MRRKDRIAIIERGLFAAAEEARRRGWVLIHGLGEVVSEDGERGGCCVTHALDHAPTFVKRDKVRPLPFSLRDVCDEFDAIESGWDGVPFSSPDSKAVTARRMFPGVSYDFYRMGVRLRKRLRPVPAESVGGAP